MSNEDDDDDERAVGPLPLLPPSGPDATLDLGEAADVQRVQPPADRDVQRLRPPTERDAQRSQPGQDDAQRLQPSNGHDAQRLQPHVDTQRPASDVQKASRSERTRSLHHLRRRAKVIVAAGAAVLAGASTILIVNAQGDDTPAAAPTTIVRTAATTDPARTETSTADTAPTTAESTPQATSADTSESTAASDSIATTVVPIDPAASSVAGVIHLLSTAATTSAEAIPADPGGTATIDGATPVYNIQLDCTSSGCAFVLRSFAPGAVTADGLTSVDAVGGTVRFVSATTQSCDGQSGGPYTRTITTTTDLSLTGQQTVGGVSVPTDIDGTISTEFPEAGFVPHVGDVVDRGAAIGCSGQTLVFHIHGSLTAGESVAAPVPAARDEATTALAKAGTLHAEDFPAPWTQYSPAGEDLLDSTSCAYRPGGATTLVAPGAVQHGPTMQFGDTGAFESSFAVVFPSDSLAKEYVGIVGTESWGTCFAGQLEQNQHDGGFADNHVAVTSRTTETLGQSGFEGYAEFSLTDGDGNIIRRVLTSFYRLGHTVIGVNEEYAALTDADATAFFDGTHRALTEAYHRVNAG